MMHFEFELAQHGIILLTLILGAVFWLTIITIIAVVLVADRTISELIDNAKAEAREEATLDEDT